MFYVKADTKMQAILLVQEQMVAQGKLNLREQKFSAEKSSSEAGVWVVFIDKR